MVDEPWTGRLPFLWSGWGKETVRCVNIDQTVRMKWSPKSRLKSGLLHLLLASYTCIQYDRQEMRCWLISFTCVHTHSVAHTSSRHDTTNVSKLAQVWRLNTGDYGLDSLKVNVLWWSESFLMSNAFKWYLTKVLVGSSVQQTHEVENPAESVVLLLWLGICLHSHHSSFS